jgi:hypothetical protein
MGFLSKNYFLSYDCIKVKVVSSRFVNLLVTNGSSYIPKSYVNEMMANFIEYGTTKQW